MADLDKVRRNVARLQSSGKADKVGEYLKLEGVNPKDLGSESAFGKEASAPKKHMDIEKELGKTIIDYSLPGIAIKVAENMTGGASEDLLPMIGGLAGGAAGGAAAGGASAGTAAIPGAMAGAAAGSGLGEAARQGVRKLRGKEVSVKGAVKDIAKETALGAAGEGVGQAVTRGVPIVGKALYKTPLGKSTVHMFGKAMAKVAELGDKGKRAIFDVMNFMGDLNPGSVQYAAERGPLNVFTPSNLDDSVLTNATKNVVSGLESYREKAGKAFGAGLRSIYKNEYMQKYPYKAPTPKGLEKISKEMRIYSHRVAAAGRKAIRDFGYMNSFSKLKPTILGQYGDMMQEGERLSEILKRVEAKGYWNPDELLTLRQELSDIIYNGWREPRTKVAIGEASSKAIGVLEAMRKEVSNRLKSRLGSSFHALDDAYTGAMDLLHQAKPMFKDEITAEKTLRKYHSLTKGHNVFTNAEQEIIKLVDQISPHVQSVRDHLVAKEFEPIISNFWKSRALQGLAMGAGGYALGGPAGAAGAGVAAMAASSPRMIRGTLKAGARMAKGAAATGKVAAKTAKVATTVGSRTIPVQKARAEKNASENYGPIAIHPDTGHKVHYNKKTKKWEEVKS